MAVATCLAEGWHGAGVPNSENDGGFVTVIARKDSDLPVIYHTLAILEQPRDTSGKRSVRGFGRQDKL
jgi:hypothetical protein